MKVVLLPLLLVFLTLSNCPGDDTPPPTPTPTPIPHEVKKEMELLITHLDVLESDEAKQEDGAFSIKTLLTNMAPQGKTPKDLILSILARWDTPQNVNGFTIPPRTAVRQLVIDPWKRKDHGGSLPSDADWNMNFANAPFRLLAIVNRIDLRKETNGAVSNAGEGRFVFGVLGENGSTLSFTLIFEYEQPASNAEQLKKWAQDWHHLGTFPSFNNDYIAALKNVTGKFAGRGMSPNKPNGSALNQLRSNHVLGGNWELREFNLDPGTGLFAQVTTKQAPDDSFNGSAELSSYINENAEAIKAGKHEVPPIFPAGSNKAFLGGQSTERIGRWNASNIIDPTARFRFSLNTCNACHTLETDTNFTHVGVRGPKQPTPLSRFLTEDYPLPDPFNNNAPNHFKEMSDRIAILYCLTGEGPCNKRFSEAIENRSNRVH